MESEWTYLTYGKEVIINDKGAGSIAISFIIPAYYAISRLFFVLFLIVTFQILGTQIAITYSDKWN